MKEKPFDKQIGPQTEEDDKPELKGYKSEQPNKIDMKPQRTF